MILVIHRYYRHRGGEDVFLEETLLPSLKKLEKPIDVLTLPPLKFNFEGVLELLFMAFGLEKLRPSYLKVKKHTHNKTYTHVIFNNFVPTISLDITDLFTNAKKIWWLHNARHSCANGLLFNGKTKCHDCLTKGSLSSLKYNCQNKILQSLFYSLAYRRSRISKKVLNSIDLFVAPANYTLQSLKEAAKLLGHNDPQAKVIRFDTPAPTQLDFSPDFKNEIKKPFYLFMGRLSYEKGADIFLKMAAKFPHTNFVMAGSGPLEDEIVTRKPANMLMTGHADQPLKHWLFANAEALILCSRAPENSPLVISESAPFGLPIVYPAGGGAEEMVKLLNRSGCCIEDFNAQKFEKKPIILSTAFNKGLSEIL